MQLFTLPSPQAHAIQIAQTGDALARAGLRVHLFFRIARGDDPRARLGAALGRAPHANVVVHAVRAGHKGIAGLVYRCQLAKLLATGSARVAFYARQRRQALFVLGLRKRFGRAARFLYEFHNLEHVVARDAGDEARAVKVRAEEARLAREADQLTAICEPLAEDLRIAFAPKAPITIVPDGVDFERFDGVAHPDLGREAITLCYAGSLFPHKGVESLLDMLAHLPERVRLRLIGGHPAQELERLTARAERDPDLRARVEFVGHVGAADVPRELARADLIVLPASRDARSERYTSPLKLFEAMATGAPIVAAPVATLASVLTDGETALLAASAEPRDLAAAVQRALDAPAHALAVGRAARDAAAAYSWDRRAALIAGLLAKNM